MARTRGGSIRRPRSDSLRISTRLSRGKKKGEVTSSSNPVRICSRSPSPSFSPTRFSTSPAPISHIETDVTRENVPNASISEKSTASEDHFFARVSTPETPSPSPIRDDVLDTMLASTGLLFLTNFAYNDVDPVVHLPSLDKDSINVAPSSGEGVPPSAPASPGVTTFSTSVSFAPVFSTPGSPVLDPAVERFLSDLGSKSTGVSTPRKYVVKKRTKVPLTSVATPATDLVSDSSGSRAKRGASSSLSGERRKKTVRKSVLPSPPNTFSKKFVSKSASEREEFVRQRSFLSERPIDLPSYNEKSGLIPLLETLGLLHSVSAITGFSENVVYEFYCNLESSVSDQASPLFHKVFVRGKFFEFSPSRISKILKLRLVAAVEEELDFNKVVSELTGGLRSLWPNRKDFPSAQLTLQYSLLHKLALVNWMPSTHAGGVKKPLAALLYKLGREIPFDLGQLIFDHICQFAESTVTFSSLIFPNLIFGILQSQDPKIRGKDALVSPPTVMKLTAKSLKRKSVSFSEMSAGVSTPSCPLPGESVSGVFGTSGPGVATPDVSLNLRMTVAKAVSGLQRLEKVVRIQRDQIDSQLALISATVGDLSAVAARLAQDDSDSSATD